MVNTNHDPPIWYDDVIISQMVGEEGEAEGTKRMGYERKCESAIWSLDSGVCNLESGVCNLESGVCNLKS